MESKLGNLRDLPYIAHATAPCIARHTAELGACPFTNEVRERVSPASPKLCHLSCMLQARPQALLCSAFLLESTPQSQACNMLRHANMRRKQAHWRQKSCERAHHRLRQPCERNIQVVWQGCRRLMQGLCAEQAHGRLRDSPGSFSR